MAAPPVSPYTFAELRTPRDYATNKAALYQNLIDAGHSSATSWEDGSTPSALVEIEGRALTNFQQAKKNILESGFNEWAEGEALREHAFQVYGNDFREGRRTIARLLLTDTGAGPFKFDPASTAFSVGKGGLLFEGIPDPNVANPPQVEIPLNGSAYVYVQAEDAGAEYNVAVGRVDTFARGILPGVTVTNPSDWLRAPGAVQGANPEGDDSVKRRNRAQWGTLGTGSPLKAYEKWVRDADVQITRVETFRNVDLLDPGTVTIIVAGDAGALPPNVILAAQNAVAPGQVGGDRIPETARAVVTSAVNLTIPVGGTIFVPGEYNTTDFQLRVQANVRAFEKAMRIGARVSRERLLGAALYVAGLDPSVIVDVGDDFFPTADVALLYYQVAVFDLSGLNFVSV